MPITGEHPPRAFFSPHLPPGNSAPNQGWFPSLFRLAADYCTFHGVRNLNFFNPLVQRSHTRCVEGWANILNTFFPEGRMISASQNSRSFKVWQDEALWQRDYSAVNSRYRSTRDSSQGVPAQDPEITETLEDISLASINTTTGLKLLTRSAVTADIVVCGLTSSRPEEIGNEEVIKDELLLFGEIKQYPHDLDEDKYRLFSMGSLAQGLRYIAYGREIFGTSYGLVAFGRLFRCMWLADNQTLYVDLGPGPSQLLHLSLEELLVIGNGTGDDPSAICWNLQDVQAQQYLMSFLTHLGQQYVNEVTRNHTFWPYAEDQHPGHPLKGKIAVIHNFSVEALAIAVKSCEQTVKADIQRRISGLLRRGSNDGNGGGADWPGSGKRKHEGVDDVDGGGAAEAIPLLIASTSAHTMSKSTSHDILPPPPSMETDDRLRRILHDKAHDAPKDLKDPANPNYGLSPEVADALRKIAGTAYEGGEDVEALLEMF